MKRIKYCRICLRTDRNLKIVDYRLSDFHDDLCDSLDYTSKSQYCSECEHLLRKLYSFTAKCKKADEVLRNWKNATPAEKKPVNLLNTLMPPTTLGLWTSESNSIYEFIEEETEPISLDVPKQIRTEDPMPSIHLKFSYNILQNKDIKLEKKDKAVSKALPFQDSTDAFEKVLIPDSMMIESIDMEIKPLNDDDVKEEQLTDSNISSDDEILNNKRSTKHSFVSTKCCKNKDVENHTTKNKSITDLANIVTDSNISDDNFFNNNHSTRKTDHSNNKDVENRTIKNKSITDLADILTDSNISSDDEILNNKRSTRHISVSTDHCNNKDVENHTTKDKSLSDLSNISDSNISSDDEILNNKRSTRNSFVSTKRCKNKDVENHTTKNKSITDLANIVTDSNISDDNFFNNNHSTRKTDRSNNKDVENRTIKNKSITDLADVLTDSNISSDDEILNNKHLTRKTDRSNNKDVENRTIKNKSITDLADVLTDSNISSDDESLNNKHSIRTSLVSTVRCNNKDVENKTTKNKSTTDLVISISDDEIIYDEDSEPDENCKVQSKRTKKIKVNEIKKHRNIKLRSIDKIKRKIKASLTTKEINAKLDIIRKKRERLEKINLSKLPFSKERLIEKLTSLFASCGELKAEDGNKINKEFILNCLDDKVPEYVMRNLWPALHGKHTFQPKAFRIFKSIQNKYKNDHKYESVFDIQYLTTEQELAEEFQKRNTYECYITAQYKCQICYQGFKYKKLLDYHLKCHDKSVGDIICSICNVRYRNKSLLSTHMCTAHGAVFKCKLCPMVTYYRASMANHYDQHRGVEFKCEPCGTTYSSRSVYINHQSKRHSVVQHACTICGRAFVSEAGLKSHASIKHRDETPKTDAGTGVKCEQCDLTFPSHEVYLKHVRITHKDLWLIISSEPGWRRQQQTNMSKKRNRCARTPKMVMTCRVCNIVGSSYGWLLQHFRTEHPAVDMSVLYADRQTHLCHVCGKGFSTVYCLRDHLNTHTGATPFPCDLCPKRFHRAMSLSQHRLRHFPPSINCTVCGKMVNTRANLFSHMRTHIGERRFKCSICDKRFLNSTTRNEHVRGVHHKIRRVRKKGVAESRAMEKVSEVPDRSEVTLVE